MQMYKLVSPASPTLNMINKVSAFFAYLNDIHLVDYDEAEANKVKQGEKLPCKSRVINWLVLPFEESSSL